MRILLNIAASEIAFLVWSALCCALILALPIAAAIDMGVLK